MTLPFILYFILKNQSEMSVGTMELITLEVVPIQVQHSLTEEFIAIPMKDHLMEEDISTESFNIFIIPLEFEQFCIMLMYICIFLLN